MKAQPGDRVRIRHKHSYGEGSGRWATVVAKQGKSWVLVVFDEDRAKCKLGIGKRRKEHQADVVEIRRENIDPISGAPLPRIDVRWSGEAGK